MNRLLYPRVNEMIRKAEHILLLTDERIDGDTIGSTLGLYFVLKEMGKHVEVYSPQPMQPMLEFLPGVEVIQRDVSIFDQESIDLAIVCDCSDGEYFKKDLSKLPQVPLIAFDHHESNPLYGSVNIVEPDAASTGDVVWRFVKAMGYSMNRNAAQCLLTAICTDTNAFTTGNTTVEAMTAAHELTAHGAKLQVIVRETMMNKSVETLKLWGLAFERLYDDKEYGALTTVILQKDLKAIGVTETESRAMIEFLHAMIEGVDVLLVLKENSDGDVKGSFRSTTTNVAEKAEALGGGGHDRAAGFKIKRAHLEKQEKRWVIVKKR
jgi:bifunctional oligoribonuclease and PAP phosphatase NrnA